MATIKQITLPSGTTYELKDEWARDRIEALGKYTYFLGVTTTAISDGSTTNPIVVNGESVTADTGAITTYGSAEFIWNGSAWQAFGDLSGLGEMAFADSATGSVQISGTVGIPTFTGTEGSVSVSGTPSGTVSQPTTTVTPNTTTVNSITDVGTLPTCTMPVLQTSVANETLTLSWTAGSFNQGTLPTKSADQTVVTGIKSAVTSQPTFSGDSMTATGKFTPAGSVSRPSFASSPVDVVVTPTAQP